jgi:hypothetical protein
MSTCLANTLNYFFNEFIIMLLSIVVWRGSYKLLDVHLYPENMDLSAVLSLLIGYVLYFVHMYTQSYEIPASSLIVFMNSNYPLFVSNLRHLHAFVSCVCIWRGFWVLFDNHIAVHPLVQQSPCIFYIVCIIILFIILTTMKTASSISGPMSCININNDLFPAYANIYLTQWLNDAQKQKTNKMLNDMKHDSSLVQNGSTTTITLF